MTKQRKWTISYSVQQPVHLYSPKGFHFVIHCDLFNITGDYLYTRKSDCKKAMKRIANQLNIALFE